MVPVLLAFLLAFALAQNNDPCTAATGDASFTVIKISTAVDVGRTNLVINATNIGKSSVFYIQFALGTTIDGLQPSSLPSTYVGKYQWKTSIVNDNGQRWLRFTPTNSPLAQMAEGKGIQWEVFNFFVTNYDPVFPHFFQMHPGTTYPTVGPLDMSLCRCTSDCDAGFSQRTIRDCNLGYANAQGQYSGPTNRAPSIFNENKVLFSYQIYDNFLSLFYTDEYPMCLGVRQVVNNLDGSKVTNYPLTAPTTNPTCIFGNDLKFGATSWDGRDPQAGIDGNADNNGCQQPTVANPSRMTCGRPMPPTLFITDITDDAASRVGDWQMGGTPHLPQLVCGLWKPAVKTITGVSAAGVYTFNVNPESGSLPPSNYLGNNQWNFGAGSHVPPLGFINPSAVGTVPYPESYGTEVAWNLDELGLISKHSYRFQFLVHDGDSTKTGGDVGQACLITNQACPAGFSGTNCDECDTVPLPGDGTWTWWCSPTGNADPAYLLQKLPKSKILNPPYIGSGGFVPSENYTDSQGYIVGCNCVRKILPCPAACCGNGVCRDNIGQCVCIQKPEGVNLTTCCLPPPPPPVSPPPPVQPPPPPPVFTPPPVPPPVAPPPPPPVAVPVPIYVPTCADVVTPAYNGSNNCSSCVENKLGIQCAWCPQNITIQPPNRTLVEGNCRPVTQCGGPEFYTCTAPPPPPTCEDNLGGPEINCTTCIYNTIGIQCSWCPDPAVASYANESLVQGSCRSYTKCPKDERYTCAVPPPPIPPCYNNGTFCSGHGNCINNTCVCEPQPPLDFTGVACEVVIEPPPRTCQSLNQTNCSGCFATASAAGMRCVWCSSPNNTDRLNSGKCYEDVLCALNDTLSTCVPPTKVTPPECPDNCSNTGICVNISECKRIQKLPNGIITINEKVYYCDNNTLQEVLANNQSAICACVDGTGGINCFAPAAPVNIALAAGLAGGIIAAIVVAALLAAALCGGGTAAAASAMSSGPGAGVMLNPIYQDAGTSATNPLWPA